MRRTFEPGVYGQPQPTPAGWVDPQPRGPEPTREVDKGDREVVIGEAAVEDDTVTGDDADA